MSMVTYAVIDRIEAGQAILLVGDEERELTIPVQALPATATDGTRLAVTLADGVVVGADVDAEGAEGDGVRIEAKLAQLRRRGRWP